MQMKDAAMILLPSGAQRLKLKQASLVLQLPPKELQNFVQFGVVSPKKGSVNEFGVSDLCRVAVAKKLKTSLGMTTERIRTLLDGSKIKWDELIRTKPACVVFNAHTKEDNKEVEVRIPFRDLACELESRLVKVKLYKDLPRGRKRPGWESEFIGALQEAAEDLGDVSEEEIQRDVLEYRKSRKIRNK